MDLGFNSNVKGGLPLDGKLMVDEKRNGSNNQLSKRYKLALDIIAGVGFVLTGALAVVAYIQFSPILLIAAVVVAITSVALLILRCVIGRNEQEVVSEEEPQNNMLMENLEEQADVEKQTANLTENNNRDDIKLESNDAHKPNDIVEINSVIETILEEEPLVEVLTVNWTESEDVHVDQSTLDKPADLNPSIFHSPNGLPPFVVPYNPNIVYSPIGLPTFVIPNSLNTLNPPITASNTSESTTVLQDEKHSIIFECKETADDDLDKVLVDNDLPPFSDMPPTLNTSKALPVIPPRNTVQATVKVNLDFDLPPSDMPPPFPEDLQVIPTSASVISPALLEQVSTEKVFGKSIRCGVKILAKIIDYEKTNLNTVDPLILKMLDHYEVIAELSPKIGNGLKEAKGNLSEIERVIKTLDFDDYRQNLKEIILEFDLFDQMVKEIIQKNSGLQDDMPSLKDALGKIMQSYGFSSGGHPTAILQCAIKRMSQHEMILKEELNLLKKNGYENEEDFKRVENLIENLRKDNEDTNSKQKTMLDARIRFDELNDKISKLAKKDSRKLDSNLEVVKEDHLISTKHLKSMSRSLIGKKKESNELEPAERLKKLLDEISKLSDSRGIKKEKVQAMCSNLAESEWAQKILKKEKSLDLANCLMEACGTEK